MLSLQNKGTNCAAELTNCRCYSRFSVVSSELTEQSHSLSVFQKIEAKIIYEQPARNFTRLTALPLVARILANKNKVVTRAS